MKRSALQNRISNLENKLFRLIHKNDTHERVKKSYFASTLSDLVEVGKPYVVQDLYDFTYIQEISSKIGVYYFYDNMCCEKRALSYRPKEMRLATKREERIFQQIISVKENIRKYKEIKALF